MFAPLLSVLISLTPGLTSASAPGSAPPAACQDGKPAPAASPAQAELAAAAALRAQLRGKEGAEREGARQRAVAAYRLVREHWPNERAIGAEASFRAAELLRSGQDAEGARAEFEKAQDLGRGSPLEGRAGLEIAHIDRRAEKHEAALAQYLRVAGNAQCTHGLRDEAWSWAARCHSRLGQRGEALEAWKRLSEQAEDPVDRVHAFDDWACELVRANDLEAAAGVLQRCRESLAESAAEETRSGERVRNALARMRAVEQLQSATDKRSSARSAREDA